MKTITKSLLIFLVSGMFYSATVSAQLRKKPVPAPITYDSYHAVANTSKSKIFNELLKSEQKLSGGKKSILLESDSTKGILNIKRTAYCSYMADTTFNGKVLKNAVTKRIPYNYIVNFKIDNNIFTFKIMGFYRESGQQIMKNDIKDVNLSSCAQGEIWSFSDHLSATVVLMGVKSL
jgi:hypothetical protein